jgi:hypothetical protein
VTAAAAVVLTGAWQALEAASTAIVLVVTAIMAALILGFGVWGEVGKRRARKRVTHVVRPGDIGDDAIAMIRKAREEDRAEAEADALPVVAEKRRAEVRPRHGCDDDTGVIDGLTTALNEIKENGR